jgi:hypothetical protein
MLQINDYPREKFAGYWEIVVYEHSKPNGERLPNTAMVRVMLRDGSLVAENIFPYQTDEEKDATDDFIKAHMVKTMRGE